MNHSILELQGIKVNPEIEQPKPEDEGVECVETKIQIWDGDTFDEFESDYLNQIYPLKIHKKSVPPNSHFIFHFLSSSLHYWIEFVQGQPPSQGEFGRKDIKLLSQFFEKDECDNWIAFRRWGQFFQKKAYFEKRQQQQQQFTEPQGEIVHKYTRGNDEFIIVKYTGDNKQFAKYKQRMEVLFLFYIDGVSFIQEEIDTWIYYLIFKVLPGKKRKNFVGALSEYDFRLTVQKERHRISQVFILPSYQKYGHGKEMLDVVYEKSIKNEKCFEITTQIPSFQYQCLRDYKQLQLLIQKSLIDVARLVPVHMRQDIYKNRERLLTKEQFRKIKQILKIPGHQIQRLVNILIFSQILSQNDDVVQAHFQEDVKTIIVRNRSPFITRRKLPHLTLFGKVPHLKDFFLERAKQGVLRNEQEVLEILQQSIKGFRRVISKLKKVNLIK